jgi:uncharacterized metal-binding protein YceD (DUF177 family)
VDDLVHLTGKVKTQLYLLCSLCADNFQFPVQLQFHVLLTQSQVYGEVPRETSRKSFDHDGDLSSWLDDDSDEDDSDSPPLNLSASDFEVTILKEPIVDLKEILHEQILLTIPMQPKPDKNDDGDCSKCGKSQMSFQPEGQEPLKENPFAVLKNFKKKSDEH